MLSALLCGPCLLAPSILFADIEDLVSVEQIFEAEDVLDYVAMCPDARENGAIQEKI
jgi:hypothetical protein